MRVNEFKSRFLFTTCFVMLSLFVIEGSSSEIHAQTIALDLRDMKLVNVTAETVTFKGKKALKVVDINPTGVGDEGRMVLLTKTDFQDGVIELDISGEPGPNAPEGARGFVGVGFRVGPDQKRFECFYLRPTNGRADDQVRRNHSVQYISVPGFPWQLLRKDFPEKYESYVDLVPGQWTKVKIEVRGEKAKLYVNGVAQATLIVNDLKQGVTKGAIALWVGNYTLAHFANVKVSP